MFLCCDCTVRLEFLLALRLPVSRHLTGGEKKENGGRKEEFQHVQFPIV